MSRSSSRGHNFLLLVLMVGLLVGTRIPRTTRRLVGWATAASFSSGSGASFLEPMTFKSAAGEAIPGYAGGIVGAPAVIVIQEWWGVTDQVKKIAERLSKAGRYRVLVPDIYKGKVGVDAEEAHHLMSNVRRSKEMVASKSIHHFALSIDSFIDRLIDLI